ncbi:MAG: hypothetical protein FWE23_10510 [Chitinivibrionia bacterium]|nr:hypothetical protein [Chitinivibrionia bacterium]
MEKWEREMAAIRAVMAESAEKMADTMKGFARIEKQQEANAKGFAELKVLQAESTANLTRIENLQEEQWKKLRKSIKSTNRKIGGIDDSNCQVAEDYFYNSLKKTKTIGNVHFDHIMRNLSNTRYTDNGTLMGEYDIVMTNKVASCIVEVKYKVCSKDVNDLKDKVSSFKALFSEHAKEKIYLAIGGMSFDRQAEEAARKHGIAILKLKGNAVEVQDSDLKVY